MLETGLYAGLLGLTYVVLSVRAVRARIKTKTSLGDGGHPELIKTIRVHGNFAEYAPFTLLLMGLYELQDGLIIMLHAAGITLLLARMLHIIGIEKNIMPARVLGTALTMLDLIVLSALLIIHYFTL